MLSLIFEWDEDKAGRNLEKHGVSFIAAVAVFEDPRRIERLDLRQDYVSIGTGTGSLIGMQKEVGPRSETGILSTHKFLQSEERGPGWKPIGGPTARRSTAMVIGHIQLAAGEAAASFSVAAAVDFAAGDVLAIAAPDPQDATLADIALTLVLGFT